MSILLWTLYSYNKSVQCISSEWNLQSKCDSFYVWDIAGAAPANQTITISKHHFLSQRRPHFWGEEDNLTEEGSQEMACWEYNEDNVVVELSEKQPEGESESDDKEKQEDE